MYTALEKTAKMIAVWGDSVGTGGVSTTSALIASGLADKKKRVLILSTDKGPYDGVSILSDLVMEDTMDNLLILAASGGVKSADDLAPFVLQLSDYLFCLKGSNELEKMSAVSQNGFKKILTTAMYMYDFIVVDVHGQRSGISDMIIQMSDLVVSCISQNKKHLCNLDHDSVFRKYLAKKTVMVIVTKYQVYDFFTIKHIEKQLGVQGLYTLSEDDQIHKAVCTQNLAAYVFKALSGGGGGFLNLKRKNNVVPIVVEELQTIVADIEKTLKTENEEEEEDHEP